ncbi:MAG TPA: AI-2E family transporter [Gaiellaceae bacterium]|nr:AI-2E family transporter [Gaiellaceae bacterium]
MRLPWNRPATAGTPSPGEQADRLEPDYTRVFRPPPWLRDLGLMAWFLVGLLLLLVGVVWIMGLTATIVDPVAVGGVIAIVAAPIVSWLQRHHVPRGAGAAIVLVTLIGVVIVVFALVIGGIVDQSSQIKSTLDGSLNSIESWFNDAGANGTSGSKSDVAAAVAGAGSTVLHGLANGIRTLTSLVFFLTFTAFSIFFLLAGGPGIRRWVDHHLGLPVELASLITGNVMRAMRLYFVGVTAVAAFNALVVGIGALILGVPLAGTIAIVTFVTAYIPYIGAFISGAFAVLLALGSEGTTTALIMLVIVIIANGFLQNLFQPLAFGAALDLNPLAVLIVTISAGALFGMIGMIVAAPLLSAGVHIARQLAAAKARAALDGPPRPDAAPQPAGP